jgi:hypothetical protein
MRPRARSLAANSHVCVLNPNIATGTEDHAFLAGLLFTSLRTVKGAICFS